MGDCDRKKATLTISPNSVFQSVKKKTILGEESPFVTKDPRISHCKKKAVRIPYLINSLSKQCTLPNHISKTKPQRTREGVLQRRNALFTLDYENLPELRRNLPSCFNTLFLVSALSATRSDRLLEGPQQPIQEARKFSLPAYNSVADENNFSNVRRGSLPTMVCPVSPGLRGFDAECRPPTHHQHHPRYRRMSPPEEFYRGEGIYMPGRADSSQPWDRRNSRGDEMQGFNHGEHSRYMPYPQDPYGSSNPYDAIPHNFPMQRSAMYRDRAGRDEDSYIETISRRKEVRDEPRDRRM